MSVGWDGVKCVRDVHLMGWDVTVCGWDVTVCRWDVML